MEDIKPPFPKPGTTYGPDAASLDELRAVLRAWPGRGEWRVHIQNANGTRDYVGTYSTLGPDDVSRRDIWTLVRDTAEPEPEPKRTVTAATWQYLRRNDGEQAWYPCCFALREDADDQHASDSVDGYVCGPVVEVRAALPLPVEPAVVVGEVVDEYGQ